MTDDLLPRAAGIRGKLRRAARRAGLSGESSTSAEHRRLPPGQRLVEHLPILDIGARPNIRPEDFRLTLAGAVEKPAVWDWDSFLALPQTTIVRDIHCVTNWSVYDQEWIGVRARDVLEQVRPRPEARVVMLKSHDGYSANVPLAVFASESVLLAHTLNGAPLAPSHGGPVRAVIPCLYFWKSVKWLRRIELLEHDAPGYWEARGYHNDGDPWKEQRYDSE